MANRVRDLSKEPARGPANAPDDDQVLAGALFALAHPVRLSLARVLRHPRWLSEISIKRQDPSGRPTTISRQGLREHMSRLLEANLVRTAPGTRDGRRGPRYVLHHANLYALSEVLRQMARLRSLDEADDSTAVRTREFRRVSLDGPCVVMVKGPEEGWITTLDATRKTSPEWILGRNRAADIILDHDLYVSSKNTAIAFKNGGHFIRDLPSSRNGTLLNFQELPKGHEERLQGGDLIGVGQTILMFRE